MGKLIELLNEYIEKNINTPNRCIGYSCSYFGFDGGTDVIEDTIISKRYGFIKWLVENDKIDFDKCGLDVRHYLSYNKRYDKGIVMAKNYDNDTFVVREFYSPYEQLLMLLSISDTPIEFLISLLKNV